MSWTEAYFAIRTIGLIAVVVLLASLLLFVAVANAVESIRRRLKRKP